MCAISGIVGLFCNDNIISKMEQTMLRRGPDGRGVFQQEECMLLHRRLAIVDPEGGAQPMHISAGQETYTLIYNGELYNAQDLRREMESLGHVFSTHSDTEVLLHAYVQWKEKCLHKINGIFGFAVWEHKRKRLFIVRDRLGVKPLFYSLCDRGIIFASEIKTILASGFIKPVLDAEGAAQLLLLGPGRKPGSGVFRDIKELEPGWYGVFEKGALCLTQYWKLTDRKHLEDFEETAQNVCYLVTDSIRRQMVSDVPLGTFLSGGLDSSIISAVCARNMGENLRTFSVDYENNEKFFTPGKFQPSSDNYYINIMQKYLDSRHHWTVLSAEELENTLEEATQARDLPGMADVDFSLLAFCKRIRGNVKMALSGECADEIFGGYPWYRDPQVRSVNGFPWAQNTAQRQSFMSSQMQRIINAEGYISDLYQSSLRNCEIMEDVSPLEYRMRQMMNLNIRWFMQTLLDRKDRMSMYCGLEVRVPFCDYRIAEYLYSVPWEYKDYQGREKGLLRYAMKDYLPEEVLYRKKSPYPKTWDPEYRKQMALQIQKLLTQKNAPAFEFVSREAVEKLLSAEYEWPWYGQLMKAPQTMAYILQINYWIERYKVDIQLT